MKKSFDTYGETLKGAAEAIWEFNKEIIDHTWDLIPAVKPQIAMYEQFGIEGLIVYKKTVDYCHEKGLIVIGDAKRGDIGSTSAAYAAGHLGKVQVGSNAFSGFDRCRSRYICRSTAPPTPSGRAHGASALKCRFLRRNQIRLHR